MKQRKSGKKSVFLSTSFYLRSVVYLRTNMAAEFQMNSKEKKVRKQQSLPFLEKVKRRRTSQRIRKHIPACWCFFSVFSYIVPPPRRRVNGPDASLCDGRWRDCFPSLMKGGCWRLIPGYLGH